MNQVTIPVANTHFSKLIQRVLKGEEIIIAKGNVPLAKLIPLQPTFHDRKVGSAKGTVTISPDFDAPLEDFQDYIG